MDLNLLEMLLFSEWIQMIFPRKIDLKLWFVNMKRDNVIMVAILRNFLNTKRFRTNKKSSRDGYWAKLAIAQSAKSCFSSFNKDSVIASSYSMWISWRLVFMVEDDQNEYEHIQYSKNSCSRKNSNGFIERRSGIHYASVLLKGFLKFRKNNLISSVSFMKLLFISVLPRLLPSVILNFIYKRFARN